MFFIFKQYCSQELDTSFESTHNGMELPYGNGGLIPNNCMNCLSMNDNWEYEVNEMCKSTYENAGYRCEQKMESYNWYYGQNNQGCGYLDSRLTGNNYGKYTNNFANAADSFFREQSEATKMAAGTIALFILASLVGASAVLCLAKKTVQKVKRRRNAAASAKCIDNNASLEILKWNEEDKLDERGIIMNLPSMIEFVRSTTKMMKTTVHNSATKIAAMTPNTSKSANKGRNNAKIDNTDSNNNKGDDYNTMVDCDEEDEIVTVEDFVIT
jgi:hypothetical protein